MNYHFLANVFYNFIIVLDNTTIGNLKSKPLGVVILPTFVAVLVINAVCIIIVLIRKR
jgi:hypothetical protein